jgi:hypothetical protein
LDAEIIPHPKFSKECRRDAKSAAVFYEKGA